MPIELNRLSDGWLELESDPGLFTLLLEDFGVLGVQVEEIYDLQKAIEGPVYGFIFLFKWIEERRARRKFADDDRFVQDESVVNSMFFAHQIVPNSCATHALLSILLNYNKLHLGEVLTRLKTHSADMTPDNKGLAIGNTPELANAHNSHAKPEPRRLQDRSSHGISTGSRTVEAFHFVSFVPINDRLYELDGLKPYPIDHGVWEENEDWTDKFCRLMTERLGGCSGGEIRYNLMAVVPDKRHAYEQKLRTLKTNKKIVVEALQQLVKLKSSKRRKSKHGRHSLTESSLPETESENKDSMNIDGKGEEKSIESEPLAYPVHPALSAHDYAKSPLMEANVTDRPSTSQRSSTAEFLSSLDESLPTFSSLANRDVIASPTATVCAPPKGSVQISPPSGPSVLRASNQTIDYTKPLTIQTRFENCSLTSGSSTETASDVGSAFNSPRVFMGSTASPGGSLPTPNTNDIEKLVIIKVSSSDSRRSETDTSEAKGAIGGSLLSQSSLAQSPSESGPLPSPKYPNLLEPHHFEPRDLMALLKNIDADITSCEASIKDEIEKRKKYRVDESRRTHDYDEFISTFLTMLAAQGKLVDQAKNNMVGVPGRQGNNGAKFAKGSKARSRDRRKRRKH